MRLFVRIGSFRLNRLTRTQNAFGRGNDFYRRGVGYCNLRSKSQIQKAAHADSLADKSTKIKTRPLKYLDVALQDRDRETAAAAWPEQQIASPRPYVDVAHPAFDNHIARRFFREGARIRCGDDGIIGVLPKAAAVRAGARLGGEKTA